MSRRGLDALRGQLSALESTLESFDAPDVDEHPGLQLMAGSLRERTEHVRRTIADLERSSLAVRLEGRAVDDGSAPVALVGEVLAALAAAVAAAGEVVDADRGAAATALHLLAAEADGGAVTLELGRPSGPLDAQPVAASGGLVVDLALEAVARALAGGAQDADDDPTAAARVGAARLAAALRGVDVVATIEVTPATRRERTIVLTGAELAQLAAGS